MYIPIYFWTLVSREFGVGFFSLTSGKIFPVASLFRFNASVSFFSLQHRVFANNARSEEDIVWLGLIGWDKEVPGLPIGAFGVFWAICMSLLNRLGYKQDVRWVIGNITCGSG